MDILRKELNEIYLSQHLELETLDQKILDSCRTIVSNSVIADNACRVITDASSDTCFIYGGKFAHLLGLTHDEAGVFENGNVFFKSIESSDEDDIYNLIHPEDLVDKRMLEYEFFKFVDVQPVESKCNFKATCRIRFKCFSDRYLYVNNTTKVFRLSPHGKIWLILCSYELSPDQESGEGISPKIINEATGEIMSLSFSNKRSEILSEREKEILILIRDGKLSKQIAAILGISINTVNRHRQNIIEKLCVSNSTEAVFAASSMKLI